MNLNHLKKIKLTDTHKGILAGLGLLVLIVGFAYFFYPVIEGNKNMSSSIKFKQVSVSEDGEQYMGCRYR